MGSAAVQTHALGCEGPVVARSGLAQKLLTQWMIVDHEAGMLTCVLVHMLSYKQRVSPILLNNGWRFAC